MTYKTVELMESDLLPQWNITLSWGLNEKSINAPSNSDSMAYLGSSPVILIASHLFAVGNISSSSNRLLSGTTDDA